MKTLEELEDKFYMDERFENENVKPEDYDEILDGVNEILAEDPSNIDALKFKSYLLYCQDKYEESIEVCDLILKKDPDNIKVLQEKADNLLQLDRYKECIDLCQQILRIDPKNEDVLETMDIIKNCPDTQQVQRDSIKLIIYSLGYIILLIAITFVFIYFTLKAVQNSL